MSQIIGQVDKTGEVNIGAEYITAGRKGTGVFKVTYINKPFKSEPVVTVTAIVDDTLEATALVGIHKSTGSGFEVILKDSGGQTTDRKGFNFIATDE